MMPDDFLNDNPKKIWQKQPKEAPTMTLEMIRQRASESRSKTRRELFGSIATVLIVVAICGFGIYHASSAVVRLVFVAAIVWVLAGQGLLHRGMWSASGPADATLKTGLEFYRRELERQQDLIGRVLRWSFGPVILSVGTLIVVLVEMATGRSLPIRSVMPFGSLFVIWVVAFLVRRSRGQRKLRQEIDELRMSRE